MQISSLDKFDCLFCSDLHIRPDTPVGRKEGYLDHMVKKLKYMITVANRYKVPVVVAGDFGHRAGVRNWPPWLLSTVINTIKDLDNNIYVIPGQHDLPNHNLEYLSLSGLHTLATALDNFHIQYQTGLYWTGTFYMEAFCWGTPLYYQKLPKDDEDVKHVAVCHMMVVEEDLWAGQDAPKAKKIIEKYPYDLMVFGDNHNDFVYEHPNGNVLLNCGAMMRSKRGEEKRIPKFYLWNVESNWIKTVEFPIEPDVWVQDVRLDIKKEQSQDIFTDSLKKTEDIDLDFTINVEKKIKQNNIDIETANIVRNWVYDAE